jgi:hypothetical protein
MAVAVTSPPEQGQLVNVRQRHYVVMIARQAGLTKTYNRFHDPEETG